MKTIKIRFIGHYKKEDDITPENYTAQIKRWYGWRCLLSCTSGGFGDVFCEPARFDSKAKLLTYIYGKFKTTDEFLRITEYSELKKY